MLALCFGRFAASRAEWPLDPGVTYLNHGTVGAAPRRVLAAQQAIRDEMERAAVALHAARRLGPGSACRAGRPTRMRQAAAERSRAFVGARGRRTSSSSTTRPTGANAVLRSMPLAAGDEILVTDHAYGARRERRGVRRARAGRARRRVDGAVSGLRPRRASWRRSTRAIGPRRGSPSSTTSRRKPRSSSGRGDRRSLPDARRARARRRRARAGRARARRAVAGRRLVHGEPAQVGVRAAQLRIPLGARRSARPAPSAGDLVGPRQGFHGRVRLGGHARSVAVARGAGRDRVSRASSTSTRSRGHNHDLAWRGAQSPRPSAGARRSAARGRGRHDGHGAASAALGATAEDACACATRCSSRTGSRSSSTRPRPALGPRLGAGLQRDGGRRAPRRGRPENLTAVVGPKVRGSEGAQGPAAAILVATIASCARAPIAMPPRRQRRPADRRWTNAASR